MRAPAQGLPAASLRAARAAASRRAVPAPRRRPRLGHWWPAGAAALLVWLCVAGPSAAGHAAGPTPRTAVLYDALSAADPNPAFVRAASALLAAHGYRVTYVDAAGANLSTFTRLPEMRPGILLLRTHAAVDGDGQPGLFTAEAYDDARHGRAFRHGAIGPAALTRSDLETRTDRVVAVRPAFLDGWDEDLPASLVVAMGCDTLGTRALAKAFLAHGAQAYVGWDGQVGGRASDDATLRLLRGLLDGDASVEEAIRGTAAGLEPEPGGAAFGWAGHREMTLPAALPAPPVTA